VKNLTVLEKILLSIVGFMTASWLGWLSVTVVGLSNDTREDIVRWQQIQSIEARMDKFHSE
jgi:hypothetical protein